MQSWCRVLAFLSFIISSSCLPSNSSRLTPSATISNSQNGSSCSFSIESNVVDYHFPYVIPYNTTQSCDIYGPTCQPGSITLSSGGKDCRTTLATVPCSSYLASQSTYLSGFQDPAQPGARFPRWPNDWLVGFGRSPECRSYAKQFAENQATVPWTFSQCQGDNAAGIRDPKGYDLLPYQVPPGVLRKHAFDQWACCGNCTIDIPEVRLYYFREKTADDYCRSKGRPIPGSNSTGNDTSNPAQRLAKRVISLAPDGPGGSIAVVSGHTLTSPSIYVEVVGTVAANDFCGPLGSALTSPFIAVPSGGISTYELPTFTVGQEYYDPVGVIGAMFVGAVKPLKIEELECPTFGLGKSTGADGKVHTTVGPPWLPVVAPPSEVLSLNPIWNSLCPGVLSYAEGMKSFAIFDPPHALAPGEGLINSPTQPEPSDPTPNDPPSGPGVQPGQSPNPGQPVQTGKAKTPGGPLVPDDPPKNSPPKSNPKPADPPQPGPSKQNPPKAGGGAGGGQDSGQGKSSQNQSPPNNPPNDPPNKPPANPPNNPPNNPPTNSQKNPPNNPPNSTPKSPPNNTPPQNSNPNPGVGEAVANGFDYHPPSNQNPGHGNEIPPSSGRPPASQAQPPTVPQPITIGSQVVTPAAKGFTVGSVAVKPGAPAVMVDGTPISLGKTSNLVVGGKTVDLRPTPSAGGAPAKGALPVLTVGGQSFEANPSGFTIAGTPVSPGGPAVTISGTPLSLGPSGALAVGSQTYSLPSSASGASLPILSAGGQTFQANPTGFTVAGSAVSPGGPAATVSGTIVSLGPSGQLLVGSQTISLPTSSAGVGGSIAITVGGQTITPGPSGFAIAGTTISPGGSAVTISGTRLSLGSSGVLVIGSQTISLPSASPTGSSPITVAEETITPNPTGFVVDGTTVLPGGSAVVVDGTTVSLGTNGALDVGGSITTLASATPGPASGNGAGITGTTGVQQFTGEAGMLQLPHKYLAALIMGWICLS